MRDVHEMTKPVYDIAIALVRRGDTWLVAKRWQHAHLGGTWEFPGGKVAQDESAVQAALRELQEECAAEAVAERTLDVVIQEYDDRIVRLQPVICRWIAGEPRPIGSEACRWVDAAELVRLEMPAVNAHIIRAALGLEPTREPVSPGRGATDSLPSV